MQSENLILKEISFGNKFLVPGFLRYVPIFVNFFIFNSITLLSLGFLSLLKLKIITASIILISLKSVEKEGCERRISTNYIGIASLHLTSSISV